MLRPEDHAAFRLAMRAAATRRFAVHGHAGVTMRALADELGVSAMTPYRYFRDKDEVFDLVRAGAFEAFANAQERAQAREPDPVRRLRALGRAYVKFALAHPDQYRVMFQLDQARAREAPEIAAEEKRAWLPLRQSVGDAVASGALVGDPDELAHICWSAVHGLVTLHLAGKLRLGRDVERLIDPLLEHLIAGARAPQPTRRRKS